MKLAGWLLFIGLIVAINWAAVKGYKVWEKQERQLREGG